MKLRPRYSSEVEFVARPAKGWLLPTFTLYHPHLITRNFRIMVVTAVLRSTVLHKPSDWLPIKYWIFVSSEDLRTFRVPRPSLWRSSTTGTVTAGEIAARTKLKWKHSEPLHQISYGTVTYPQMSAIGTDHPKMKIAANAMAPLSIAAVRMPRLRVTDLKNEICEINWALIKNAFTGIRSEFYGTDGVLILPSGIPYLMMINPMSLGAINL